LGLRKRTVAGQQEIESAAQAVDVRADVHEAVLDLLGSDVLGGAERVADLLVSEEGIHVLVEEAGQAHVEQLDATAAVEQKGAGFQIAVDQTGGMGVLQAVGGLTNVVGGP